MNFFKGKTEYIIGLYALIAWIAFYVIGLISGIATYPVGYFQKIAFGLLGVVIIIIAAWFWLGKTFPHLRQVLDPDNTEKLNELTTWEKLKLSFWLFALFVVSTVVLASLY